MRPENIIERFVSFVIRKLHIEKPIDIEKSNASKREMCMKSIRAGICPGCCDKCAWNVLEV